TGSLLLIGPHVTQAVPKKQMRAVLPDAQQPRTCPRKPHDVGAFDERLPVAIFGAACQSRRDRQEELVEEPPRYERAEERWSALRQDDLETLRPHCFYNHVRLRPVLTQGPQIAARGQTAAQARLTGGGGQDERGTFQATVPSVEFPAAGDH